MKNFKPPVAYNDLVFRIILSIIAAHIIVTLGEDETFFQLLLMWAYYRSLLLSFLIALLLVNLVYRITVRLDRSLDWIEQTLTRAALQLFFALFIPAIFAFLLAVLYFKAYGYPINQTWYLRYDYPMIILMLLFLNVYYVAFYLFRRWQEIEQKINDGDMANQQPKHPDSEKQVFVVAKGTLQVPVRVEAIAYFFHEGDYNFLRTFDKEDFLIPETLDEVQHRVPAKQFFRATRQMIVNFNACNRFSPLEYGRLKLFLNPDNGQAIIMSQKKARQFKDWLMR